ncbi:hypothetical protein [Denitrobaculum tricleocarpae]|uniref:hypothetical protein n=1 Tax=Denitrobaculum tricleocarpae TaxID=2591009 RepID=UPI001C552C47|nr:hypothetical protein [Denitrobaculum tricleocarpae]
MEQVKILKDGFETHSMLMEPHWLVTFQAPVEDIDRIFEEITIHTPLQHGKTDKNGFRTSSGQEYYRPREGTPTGAEEEIRKRPGVDEMSFFIPQDNQVLERVIEAIYAVHSYYEPVVFVREVLRSRCKGLDDSRNPHRWWNKSGDWKTA